jgi:hypothetical protein
VINLEATEVESGPAAAEPREDAAATSAQPPPAERKPDDSSTPPTQAAPMGSPPPSESSSTEPPAGSSDRSSNGRRRIAWLPEELSWAEATAGMAGAAGALIVFLLLWLVGALSGGGAPVDFGPRLAAIEKQLGELAARPMPPSVDPKAIDALSSRLDRLEKTQAAPRAPVTDPVVLGRLNAAENALKSISDNVAALSRRSEAVDTGLRELQTRLDKLAASFAELQTTARAAAVGSDRAVRLAVAAGALRAAVERGDPFVAELATVKANASDASALSPLQPFAATGVPSEAALAQELAAILRPMLQASGAPASDANFLERLQANAEKLVRIRPVNDARGDDRGAVLARVEQRAAQANVSGALAELAKIPPAQRGQAQAWMQKAEARDHALDASRRFAAAAVAALKASP